jgi:hypothetical protein
MTSQYFNTSLLNPDELYILKRKMENNSKLDEKTGCLLWERSSSSSGYPQMKLGKIFHNRFGGNPVNPAHIYFCITNNAILNKQGFEISHLCHEKKCINSTHLTYEPQYINAAREICKRDNYCHSHRDQVQVYVQCLF